MKTLLLIYLSLALPVSQSQTESAHQRATTPLARIIGLRWLIHT